MMITHKSVVTQGRIQDFHIEGAHRTSRAPQSSAKSEPAGVRGARLMPPGHSRDLYGFSQGRSQDFHIERAHRTSRAPQSSAKREVPAGVRGARLMPPPPRRSRDLYGFSQGRIQDFHIEGAHRTASATVEREARSPGRCPRGPFNGPLEAVGIYMASRVLPALF